MKYELYTFTHGDTVWRFTNARKDIGEYKAVRGLERTNIEDENIDKAEIDITFPQPYDLGGLEDLFLKRIFYQGVHVTIQEVENSDTLVLFKGRVLKPSFNENEDTMTLSCSTAENDFKRTVLTRKYQRTCPNVIYDIFCGLNIEDWSYTATITAIDGLHIEYDTVIPNDFLNSGILIHNGVSTWIKDNNTLYREHVGLKVGDTVVLAAGCNQSRQMCHEKFNNHLRFGGFINIPNESTVYTTIVK